MSLSSQQKRISPQIDRDLALTILIDGNPVIAYTGQTVAAVLLSTGRQVFRYTKKRRAPCGIYCGMGICFDCLVKIDGVPDIRACMTPVRAGMVIETGEVPND